MTSVNEEEWAAQPRSLFDGLTSDRIEEFDDLLDDLVDTPPPRPTTFTFVGNGDLEFVSDPSATDGEAKGDRETDLVGPPRPHRLRHGIGGLAAALVVLAIWLLLAWHIAQRVRGPGISTGVAVYTIVIGVYVLSRFVLSVLYRQPPDAGIEPTVAVIVPSYNEGA